MVWLQSYGVEATWVAQDLDPGGMLYRVHNKLVNVPGQNYAHGPALAAKIQEQIQGSSLPPIHTAHVQHIEEKEQFFNIKLSSKEGKHTQTLQARTILLATGTRYGNLQLTKKQTPSPHITNMDSAYFSSSASRDGAEVKHKTVAVIGGGDAAFENAITLAQKHNCHVHLLMRSKPKARRKFVQQVINLKDHITVWPIPTTTEGATPHEDHVTLHLTCEDEPHDLDVSCAFIRIGVRPVYPNTQGFELETNASGYICVDQHQRTSNPRIFAAGDITATPMQSIVTSASEAAKAALSIAQELGAYTLTEDELSTLLG